MTGNPAELEWSNVLGDMMGATTGAMESTVVCQVQSFNRTAQTVVLVPQVTVGGEAQSVIADVPVLFPGIYWHVQEDTYGVLLVGGRNWRRWYRTGEVSAPEDTAAHELTNGIFLPDLRVQSNPRTLPANDVVVPAVAGGDVLLGDALADKLVVHEDLLGDLSSFLVVLNTWGTTNHVTWLVASAAFLATVSPKITQLTGQIAASNYTAKNVKVDN